MTTFEQLQPVDHRCGDIPSRRGRLQLVPDSRSHIHADAEWHQIAGSRRGSAALSRWGESSPHLGRHRNLNGVLAAMRGLEREESNRYWHELLALAREGDQLAKRVMLQAIVPGLEAETTRWFRVFTNDKAQPARDDIEQLVYSAAANAICQLESRAQVSWPVLDLLRATRRLVRSAMRSDEDWAAATVSLDAQQVSEQVSAIAVDDDPFDGLGQVLRDMVAAGRVSADNASLVWRTRSGNSTFEDLAAELGTSPDTLRRRRHRAEQALHGALAHAA